MASITGLQSGNFTDIDVIYTISIDGDAGQDGQVLSSDGSNTLWIDGSAIDREDLTAADTTITISGGAYDGQVARTIQTNKVPNALTSGTNVNFSSGTTYDGSAAITISSTDTDTTYQGSSTININTGTTPDTLNVLKVPNTLTAGTNVNFSSGSTYDGSAAITISSTDTNTTYQGSTNIDIDTTTTPDTINLKPTVSNITSLTFLGSPSATALTGNNYYGVPTPTTYLDLSSTTNIILPPNVYDVGSGVYRLTFTQGIWRPNDDSSYYNIAIDDSGGGKTQGAAKPMTSSLELCGFISVPNGWTVTKCLVDGRDSGGSAITRVWTMYNVYAYGSTGFITLQSGNTNAETSLGTTMTGVTDRVIMIKVITTSTSDYIRGGYLVITKN